jgi:hypothetical protein
MPYLTNLADVARSGGLNVVEVINWKTRGHGAQTSVKKIVCHHTGGPPTGDMPSLNTVVNGRPDLAGPLSHFTISRSGIVYVVAAGQCWHTGAVLRPEYGNPYAIGIEAEGTGKDPWPEAQMIAYVKLCAVLCVAFGLKASDVLGHKEICSPVGRKPDPNFDMGTFRVRVEGAINNHGAPPPAPEDEDEPMIVKPSNDDYVSVPMNGKTSLYISAGFGRTVKILGYAAVKDTPGTGEGAYTTMQHIEDIGPDQPGPIWVGPGCRVVQLRYKADHDFTVWSY